MKEILGCGNYLVNENGDVWSKKNNIFIKSWIGHNGYRSVSIYSDCKKKNYSLHRLVAIAFINNPENKPEVNHKDGNKLNNHVSNLEWCTMSENAIHAYRTGLLKVSEKAISLTVARNKLRKGLNHKLSKQVINTVNGKVYECISDLRKELGLSHTYVAAMLSGKKRNRINCKLL